MNSNSNDSEPSVARLSTMGGFCGDGTSDLQPCVLEKSDCANPEGWRSSQQMQGAPYIAHGGICLHSVTVKDIVEGEDGSRKFGACVDGTLGDERCTWSANGCSAGEFWTFPAEKDCSCDQVRVGGCEKDGEVFCAVSPDGCDDDSVWLDELDVLKATATECYLCIATSDPLSADSLDPVSNNRLAGAAWGAETSVLTAVLATTGAMLVLVGLAAGLSFLVIRRKRRTAAAASKDDQSCPTHLEVAGSGIADDNVSNLGADDI